LGDATRKHLEVRFAVGLMVEGAGVGLLVHVAHRDITDPMRLVEQSQVDVASQVRTKARGR
jgi:hypothetical protein